MCLHHKELKESRAPPPPWPRSSTTSACALPQLWRRLPIAALTSEDDPDDVAPTEAVAKVLAGLGLGPAPDPVLSADDPEVVAWRQAMADFAARRAPRALDSTRRAPVTTATAVAQRAALDHASASGGRATAGPDGSAPPAWGSAADPGSPDATGALWRDADTALQIGRAVHSALAAIDLATATDDIGRPPPEVARGRAGAHGVGSHADAIVAMVDAALASPTVAAGAPHRHWRELFVAAPVGAGVLEGFIDLVIEEDDGLVVVDYKTDRTGGPAGLTTATARYGPQVACYALALEEATGRPVRRCVLVFLGDGDAVEVVLEGAALLDARSRARGAVDELLATGA